MPMTDAERARRILQRTPDGRLRTNPDRKLTSLPAAARRLVGEHFRGKFVEVEAPYALGPSARRGRVALLVMTTAGTTGFAIILESSSDYVPLAVNLSAIERLEELTDADARPILEALLPV